MESKPASYISEDTYKYVKTVVGFSGRVINWVDGKKWIGQQKIMKNNL